MTKNVFFKTELERGPIERDCSLVILGYLMKLISRKFKRDQSMRTFHTANLAIFEGSKHAPSAN